MKIIVPLFQGCINSSVIGIKDIILLSEHFFRQFPESQNSAWFSVEVMSFTAGLQVQNFGSSIQADAVFNPQTSTADVIIIPPVVGDIVNILAENQALINFIQDLNHKGAIICSSCTGSLVLAAAGVLKGKRATTSWFSSALFKQLYPAVDLIDEKILVHDENIITTGATLSYQNLCIYLIERYYGSKVASYTAKAYLIDKGKNNQDTYAVFSMQKSHSQADILKAQNWLESNLSEKTQVSTLAELAGMSERNFLRKFKDATGLKPSEYQTKLKVEKAKALLEENQLSVKEIVFDLGYDDIDHFRKNFKKQTGLNPTDYRKQFTFRA